MIRLLAALGVVLSLAVSVHAQAEAPKLLRIGINRVLIEQDGQQKELTIFSGYGSESLLSKQTTHENISQ